MLVCVKFHAAIIINNKNWRITIKLHFENLIIFFYKSERTHMLGPAPPLFVFVRFSMIPRPPSTNVLFELTLKDHIGHSMVVVGKIVAV